MPSTARIKSKETVALDVEGLSMGRAASGIAGILRGKNRASFERHLVPDITVEVINAYKMKIAPMKMTGKIYTRYTGYPSGLKRERLEEVYAKNPEEVLRRAVWGMLPKNKLRRIFIKHLIFV